MSARKRTRARKRARRLSSLNPEEEQKEDKKQTRAASQERMRVTKEAYLRQLKKNGGFITKSAVDIGVTPRTIERYRRDDPEFRDKVNTTLRLSRDWVEACIMKKIKSGHFPAMKFYMNCKGHGEIPPDDWVERKELVGNASAPLHVEGNIDVPAVRDEVSDKALANAMAKVMSLVPEVMEGDKEEEKS